MSATEATTTPPAPETSELPEAKPVPLGGRIVRGWLTLTLLASAVLYLGYNAWIGLGEDDTNHLETTLALAIARGVHSADLYGPFGEENPYVLIHAPLYYRLSIAVATLATRLGTSPIVAALGVGRAISFASMLGLMGASAWIAGRHGGTGRSRLWAALLVGGSPVFGSFSATVRPDVFALMLQTLGAGLVLVAIEGGRNRSLVLGWIALAMAALAKQHLVVSAAVALVLAIVSWARGRLRAWPLIVAVVLAGLVGGAYLAGEEVSSGGRMSACVVKIPSELRKIAPAGWGHVGTVFFTAAKLGAGGIALALAVLFASGRKAFGGRFDAVLWLFFLAETAAMVPLCLGSTGAWVNYAMPSAVWGSILLARALDRASETLRLGPRALVVMVASLAFLAADARLVAISASDRLDDRALLAQVLDDPNVKQAGPGGRYFVSRPQFNRMFGRAELAHDEWLYDQFEGLKAAEPREEWLGTPLRSLAGPIWVVIAPSDPPGNGREVPGVGADLPHLGYHLEGQYGRYAVWARGLK